LNVALTASERIGATLSPTCDPLKPASRPLKLVAEINSKLQGLPTAWQTFGPIVTSAVATGSAGAAIVFTLPEYAPT
jgi:hypothetical protein